MFMRGGYNNAKNQINFENVPFFGEIIINLYSVPNIYKFIDNSRLSVLEANDKVD